jgi:hypothetical protein
MSLIKRLVKGTPLTFAEGDANLDFLENLANATSSFATTGSNEFIGNQSIFGNLNVYGTSSIQYTTSSQAYIGDSLIVLSTDLPSIRFGGISVYDSGSSALSGSLFWDSQRQHWVYANPSGSTYDGGLIISGPKNTNGLGNEQGLLNNVITKGQGNDHITSSALIEDGTTFTSKVNTVISGSLDVTGIIYGSIAGSIASASYAQTSSYSVVSISSSFATTASYARTASFVANAVSSFSATTAISASFATTATSASFATTAQTASYILNAVSSSYALSASVSQTSSFATTASYFSGSTLNATSASFATTSSLAIISTYTSEWILGASGSNHYTFSGPGFTGSANDPTIYLVRGQQYKFTNTMGMHPFRIQTTINGSVGPQYNNGVTNNDVSNGTLIFNVPMDVPNTLYYQCTAHAGMGGPIYLLDQNPVSSSYAISSSNAVSSSNANLLEGIRRSTLATTGSNTFIGNQTINGVLTVSSSVVINGIYVGASPSNASPNIVLGSNALNNISVGAYNTAMGELTLPFLTTGSFNTALGYTAGNDLQSGSYNMFLGRNSGANLITGSFNTFIGAVSFLSQSTFNNTIIIADGAGSQRLFISSSGLAIFSNDLYVSSSMTTSGSLTVQRSTAILSQVSQSFNFANDLAASGSGIPLGGLYHTSGTIKIRLV